MGIENATRSSGATTSPSHPSKPLPRGQDAAVWSSCAHYPAWGSQAGNGSQPTHHCHYPSWGSKTATRRRGCHRVTKLITPHGDRKPVGDLSSELCTHCRPPGSTRTERPTAVPAPSHYPSWGSKTYRGRVPLANRRTVPAPHYPSWGSKTPDRRVGSGVRHEHHLITPHGDRKPGRSASASVTGPRTRSVENYHRWLAETAEILSARAHYPSWGSKTVWPTVTGCMTVIQFWVGDLITPHGDRKQECGPPMT